MKTATVRPMPLTIDGQQLRRIMGEFATGVTIITTGGPDPSAMTLNALTSVSLNPALILACVGNSSRILESVHLEGQFGISILGSDQGPVAQNFAGRDRARGPQGFAAYRTHRGPRTGVPLFSDAIGWMECRVREAVVAGDHTIFVGEVLRGARGRSAPPLLFHGGGYPAMCAGGCGDQELSA